MMQLSKFIYKKATLFIAVLFTIIMGLYAWFAMGSIGDCISSNQSENIGLLGLQFGYTIQTVISLFQSLNTDGLVCYQELLKVQDSIFPFVYGSMYITWLSIIYKNIQFKNQKLRLINLYPIIPLTADLIENFFESKLLEEYVNTQTVSENMVELSSLITQIKWFLSSANYLLLLIGIILLIINKQRT